jgi:hypothetical protein
VLLVEATPFGEGGKTRGRKNRRLAFWGKGGKFSAGVLRARVRIKKRHRSGGICLCARARARAGTNAHATPLITGLNKTSPRNANGVRACEGRERGGSLQNLSSFWCG